MIKEFTKWLAKIFSVSLEPTCEIVDNIDVFVKDKLNSMVTVHQGKIKERGPVQEDRKFMFSSGAESRFANSSRPSYLPNLFLICIKNHE